MRELKCIQARSIIKAFLEAMTEFEDEDIREAEGIGKVWNENILPAFYHIKNCKGSYCRAYWTELHELALKLQYLKLQY